MNIHQIKLHVTSVMNLQYTCILSNTVPLSQLFVLQLVNEFDNYWFTSTCTCKSSYYTLHNTVTIKAGSQYDAGATSATSVVNFTRKNLFFTYYSPILF